MRRHTGSSGTGAALGAVAIAALALGGCHPKHASINFSRDGDTTVSVGDGHVSVPGTLDCPAQVDELSRTAQAANGQSCAYSGSNGQTVEISLMPLAGQTPQVRLTALEQTLKGQVGPVDPNGGVHIAADGDHDNANIDLPGFHLHANGGKASIQMPGVNINADGDKANVNTGWGSHRAVVNANSNGAEVRAGDVNGSVADLTYVLASSKPGPTGLRAVGYIARGPASGPLVVGVFRTPEDNHQHELNDHGLQRLMRMNTGQG